MTNLTQEKINELLEFAPASSGQETFSLGGNEEEENASAVRERGKNRWSKNAMMYFGVVAGGCFLVFLVLALFYQSTYGSLGKEPKSEIISQELPSNPQQQDYDPEDQLRAKLAIASQQLQLKQAKDKSDRVDLQVIKRQKETKSEKPVAVSRSPRSEFSVKPLSESTPVRKSKDFPTQSQIRGETTPLALPQRFEIPSKALTPTPKPKKQEQEITNTVGDWVALANMGVYGRGETDEIAANPTEDSSEGVNTLKEKPQDLERQKSSVALGQSVKGKIITPVMWSSSSEDQFLVQLLEPLKSRGDEVVVPANSFVLFKIQSVYEGGLFQAHPIALLIESPTGEVREIPLSKESLSLVGDKQGVLKASQQSYGGGVGFREWATLFTVGALGEIGEVLNRPESFSSSSSVFGTSQSTVNGEANLAGAILAGGFKPLSEQLQRQNEEKIRTLEREGGKIYVLPPQTPVRVLVSGNWGLSAR